MEWTKLGTLEAGVESAHASKRGVYLEIFPGTPRRVIYIGTTYTGFFKRPGGYWNGRGSYLRKQHYVFKADTSEDIYAKGMKVQFGKTRTAYHAEIEIMKDENLVWVPREGTPPRDMSKRWQEGKWGEFIRLNFPLLELWGCEIPNIALAEEVESRLQIALGWKYKIGYHQEANPRQNWLGRQTRREELYSGMYIAPLSFKRTNLSVLGLGNDVLEAFDEDANRRMLIEYFWHQDDLFCPF